MFNSSCLHSSIGFHLHSWSVDKRVPGDVSLDDFPKWGNQRISLWTRMQPPVSCIPWFPTSFCGFYRDGSFRILVCEFQWPPAAERFNGTLAEPAEPHKDSPRTSSHYQRGLRVRTEEFYANQRQDKAKVSKEGDIVRMRPWGSQALWSLQG